MHQKFRLFVQRHDNGAYTVTVPGIDHIALDWDDDVRPAAQSLAAHGPILEEVIDDVRQALAKWLARADASELNTYNIYREEQTLEKVEIELRPEGRTERKRRDKLPLKVSLLVTREDDGQYLVRVPRLISPQLAFYCYHLSELQTTAGLELAAYFADHTLEEGPTVQDRHFTGQVERFFRPEFVNRLDKIVVFRPLDRVAMRDIAARELAKLLEREGVTRRNLLVEIEDEMMDLLLETGFSPIYGARPLKREIEKQVIVPLARYLIANRISGSHLVRISRNGDAACLSASDLMPQKQRVSRSPGPLTHTAGAHRMDVRELIEGFAAVRLHLHEWAESDRIQEIRTEYKNLLAKTRRRNFVPYGPEANVIWQRIYHLERLTRRLDQLKDRAEYLEEFAAMAKRERAGRYEADLAGSYAELCRDTDYLEIELFCAHITGNDEALVKLEPLGRTARSEAQTNWLRTLAKMYLRWASRKGYACSVYLPSEAYKKWVEAEGFAVESYIPGYQAGPPIKPPYVEVIAADVPALLKRLEAVEIPTLYLHLRGANVFGFLRGEQGVHKLLIRSDPNDPSAPFQTATVTVSGVTANVSVPDFLTATWKAEQERKAAESVRSRTKGKPKAEASTAIAEEEHPAMVTAEKTPPIVRLYAPDGNRFVHDLPTDLRTTQVESIFEGHLDEFILAHLKLEARAEDAA